MVYFVDVYRASLCCLTFEGRLIGIVMGGGGGTKKLMVKPKQGSCLGHFICSAYTPLGNCISTVDSLLINSH